MTAKQSAKAVKAKAPKSPKARKKKRPKKRDHAKEYDESNLARVRRTTHKVKASRGRKRFEPTERDRVRVEILSGLGLTQDDIALAIVNPRTGSNIDADTLRRYFRSELDRGAPLANAAVAQSLYNKAVGDGPQAVTAGIWWTKCRMGWKEQVSVSLEVKSGVLVPPPKMDPNEWIEMAQLRTATAVEPGVEDDGGVEDDIAEDGDGERGNR